ncbi:DUF6456 domain-containing protein [uncultured Devosia sp.]|uniref:DUF6456 domain-containing protein n=1 Tax=uncultured Devosia sp. TaxID=211434 RepID=UPI0035C9C242
MATAEVRAMRFVRALLPRHDAKVENAAYVVQRTDLVARLDLKAVATLAELGVLSLTGDILVAGPRAREWLAGQARKAPLAEPAPAPAYNLDESPLARLAIGRYGEPPFLLPHQVAAGERVRRLVERARLSPRLTMSYNSTRSAGSGGSVVADLSDSAVDARRKLDAVARALPPDCSGVVFDVCGLLKGLQTVETERQWPRRSAKMVLRIGLEQLALHWGLSSQATGPEGASVAGWLDQRLPLIRRDD